MNTITLPDVMSAMQHTDSVTINFRDWDGDKTLVGTPCIEGCKVTLNDLKRVPKMRHLPLVPEARKTRIFTISNNAEIQQNSRTTTVTFTDGQYGQIIIVFSHRHPATV